LNTDEKWLDEISANQKIIQFNFKEVWRYKDLLFLFVKRDLITVYKQTVLGPLWYLIQPLLTSVIFTLIFNDIAGIDTGSIPPFLFNLAGITTWNYFKECLTATSDTFKKNENIFGKVYFPRIIMPLSVIVSNLLKFGIQLLVLLVFYIYYALSGYDIQPSLTLAFFPLLVVCMGMLGLGLGMIISSMVTKYRDLTFLVSFGVQLLMYMSAVVYPLSLIKEKLAEYAWVVEYNPMAHVIEMARYMLLNEGTIVLSNIIFTSLFTILILLFGIVIFNKTEKTFIDTI